MERYHGFTKRAAVVSVETIPPRLRQRPLPPPADFIGFRRSPGEPPEVYIRRQVLLDVAAHAQATLPNECIGLLYGRVWQDSAGAWIVLNHFAAPDDGAVDLTPGQCTLTPDGSAALQQQADLVYLAEEYTGSWAHSHVYEEPSFSPPDFAHQAKKSAEAVGLLAYPQVNRRAWAFAVYLGPHAIELRSDDPAEVPLAELEGRGVEVAGRPAPPHPLRGTASPSNATRPVPPAHDRTNVFPDDGRANRYDRPRPMPRPGVRHVRSTAPVTTHVLARLGVIAALIALGGLLMLQVSTVSTEGLATLAIAALIVLTIAIALRAGAQQRAPRVDTERLQQKITALETRLGEVEDRQADVALRLRSLEGNQIDAASTAAKEIPTPSIAATLS